MNDLRTAAQQALEALKKSHPYSNSDRDLDKHSEAIHALRAALAEPPTNQCGETCERAKLCAACARELAEPVQEPLPFGIEERAGVRVLYSKDGSCRPATAEEWLMWCQMRAHGIGNE